MSGSDGPRAFWFHFDRPETARAGEPRMSLHYRGRCHIVREIVCEVPTRSRSRRQQPRFVMAGRGVVRVDRAGTARITAR